ncbi:MAG: DUF6056 family protein [Gammaproteobacteria bacterium]|nr:DUF6056 family protein [Gammaproteobacteria bacterium]
MSKTALLFPAGMILLTSMAVLLVYIGLGHYAHPSADDYCMASGVRQNGFIPHLWDHYLEWSGRYASNTLYAIYPMVFGFFGGYQLMPFLLIVSLLLASNFFLASLFRVSMRSYAAMLMSLCFIAVFLIGMRDTASSLYWTAGAMTYQTANILLLCMLGLIIRLIDQQETSSNTNGLFIVLLLVVILGAGMHETNMLLVTTIAGIVFGLRLRKGWSSAKPWAGLLLASVACCCIVYFAPGNSVRESTFPLRHDISRALAGSLNTGLWTLKVWLTSPLLIISTLLTPVAVSSIYRSSTRVMDISKPLIVALVIVTLAIPFVLQFPAWWAMGGWPPARTVDGIYFVFLLSWFSLIGAITIRYINRDNLLTDKWRSSYTTTALLIGAIIFIMAIASNSKFRRATNDLLNRAGPHHEYMLQRYALIGEAVARQHPYLVVPEFSGEYPRSIYFNDIRPDPRDWRNVCYADYFGLQQIRRHRSQRVPQPYRGAPAQDNR